MVFDAILYAIQTDERYQANMDWGQPRRGHPEGTVRAHIEELERNLHRLRHRLTDVQRSRLRLIIHTHDTFKADAKQGMSISDPRSHASLARTFTAEFCDDADVLATIQWHDEPYALWRQQHHKGPVNPDRFNSLLENIADWDLFLAFQIIDGCTEGKSREPLIWFFDAVRDRASSQWTADDLW